MELYNGWGKSTQHIAMHIYDQLDPLTAIEVHEGHHLPAAQYPANYVGVFMLSGNELCDADREFIWDEPAPETKEAWKFLGMVCGQFRRSIILAPTDHKAFADLLTPCTSFLRSLAYMVP